MKKQMFRLIVMLVLGMMHERGYGFTVVQQWPLETIMITFPDGECADWKELSRHVTEKEGVVERIPRTQTMQNWEELLAIQYFDGRSLDRQVITSAEYFVDCIKKEVLAAYPGSKVTWRIIENNKNDVLYEWILHQPYKAIPPQHEIARAVLTDKGLHRIGWTHKNSEVGVFERTKWINLLKKSAVVTPFQEAAQSAQGLSIANRFHNSLNLGTRFKNWNIEYTAICDNGHAEIHRAPSSLNKIGVKERLEIVSLPLPRALPLEKLFKLEKSGVQQKTSAALSFHILKKSPSEIVYSYSYPQDQGKLVAVVRTFLSDQGYYSISYKQERKAEVSQEEISQWQEQLEAIKVNE